MVSKTFQTLALSASLVLGSFGAVSTSYAKAGDVVKGALILGAAAAVVHGIAKANDRHDRHDHHVHNRHDDRNKVVVIKEKEPSRKIIIKERERPYRENTKTVVIKKDDSRYDRNYHSRNDNDRYDYRDRDHRYYR